MYFTVLAVFRFRDACCDGTVGFTCHNDRICRNGQGVFVPFSVKSRELVDEIGLYWLLKGSSFDLVCSAVALVRSAEVDCTGLGLHDTWFSYRWETGEVLDLPWSYDCFS